MIKRAAALAATLALAAPAVAHAGFKEHVKVLWQHTGAEGKYYAWGVAPLEDIDHDGADEVLAGEPGAMPSDDPGWVWVQSGRTGRVIHRFEGKTGDQNGFSITDAGDADRDGVHDILSGAPRQTGDTEGHAYLYSGRSGRLLHTFAGEATGDSFGAAVTSADVNRDGRADLVVGAPSAAGGGIAYVFTGRTFQLLYKIAPPDANHAFGYGTGMTEDVDCDHRPDLIVGGGGTAYVFSGRDGHLLFPLPPSAAPRQFGTFFLAGVGDLNHDHVPDLYGGDYAAGDGGALRCTRGSARPGTDSAPAAAPATSTTTTSTTSPSVHTPTATARRAPGRSRSSPAAAGARCARSRRPPRRRTSASTRSGSATSTATTGRTCWRRRPRATRST
jgi:hypothetical protein